MPRRRVAGLLFYLTPSRKGVVGLAMTALLTPGTADGGLSLGRDAEGGSGGWVGAVIVHLSSTRAGLRIQAVTEIQGGTRREGWDELMRDPQ